MLRSHYSRIHGKPPPSPMRDGSIARKRCPRCKKVRAKWFGANYIWHDNPRAMWQRYEGQLVCHICAHRLGLPPKMAPSIACPGVHNDPG